MKHIYYFMIIFPLLWEMLVMKAPKKVIAFTERMKAIKEYDDYDTKQKAVSFFTLLYCIWALVGLASFQWPMFGIILLLSFIPKKHWFIKWIDAVITFFILVFIFLNAYHFNIDVFQVIVNYFKG